MITRVMFAMAILLAGTSFAGAGTFAAKQCQDVFLPTHQLVAAIPNEQIRELATLQLEAENSMDPETATRLRRLFFVTIDKITNQDGNERAQLLRRISEMIAQFRANEPSHTEQLQPATEQEQKKSQAKAIHQHHEMPQVSPAFLTGIPGDFKHIGDRRIHSEPYNFTGTFWSSDSRFLFIRSESYKGSDPVRHTQVIDIKKKIALDHRPDWGLPSSVDNTFAESFFLLGMKIWDLETGKTLYHLAGHVVGLRGSFSKDYAIIGRNYFFGSPNYAFFHRQKGTTSLGKAFAFDFANKRLMGIRDQRLFLVDVTSGSEIPLPEVLANAKVDLKPTDQTSHTDVFPVTINGTRSVIILQNLDHFPVSDIGSNLRRVGNHLLLGAAQTDQKVGNYNIYYTRYSLFDVATKSVKNYLGNRVELSMDGSLLLINDPLGQSIIIDTQSGTEIKMAGNAAGLLPGSNFIAVFPTSGDQSRPNGAYDPKNFTSYNWKRDTDIYPIADGNLWVSADTANGVMLGLPDAPDTGLVAIGDRVSPRQSLTTVHSQNPVVHLSPDQKHILTVKDGQYAVYDLQWKD